MRGIAAAGRGGGNGYREVADATAEEPPHAFAVHAPAGSLLLYDATVPPQGSRQCVHGSCRTHVSRGPRTEALHRDQKTKSSKFQNR